MFQIQRPRNPPFGEHIINKDELIINTNEMTFCKQLATQQIQMSNLQPTDYKKLQEELNRAQSRILESKNKFDNKKVALEKMIQNCIQQSKPPIIENQLTIPIGIRPIPDINKPEQKVPPPRQNNIAQKTSSGLRNDRNSKNNANVNSGNNINLNNNKNNTLRSERSYRAIERNTTQNTGNPLDIWVRSAPLFRPLPTEKDIDEICRAIDTEKLVGTTQSRQHWSDHLRDVVRNSQRESRKSKNQILQPPGKPPSPNEVSEYWRKRVPPFPIEDIQKNNRSTFHYLLSAFVEAKPLPKANDDDIDSPENNDFLLTHVLLPRIGCDDYLSHPFEERLELELQSAGLEKPTEGQECCNDVFSQEIEQYKEEINSLQPQIDLIHDEILSKLPEFVKDEERRMTEQQEYTELLKEFRRKTHKK
ncbi:hypothetical protein TRFO_18859 [Tritrichomonas foetus]|uniref:Uncharacterized protein n=1 Tax=Tritrichomonas foetus TaxID=1144522 RepID=A0A1J4KK53_9EUKA|nr:hypothetical protein TRFO_18859 [Tritrichomonas foetus]|eukprot:OHT11603.1 hypothetical protein TRFO_18859 [Tritrichomonas foetus]